MICVPLERKLCRFVTAAAFVLCAAGGLNAQQTGVVTGQVVNGRTLQPMAVVQVDIPDLQIGGLTQANGRFLLLNVPAGAYSLRVNRLGFRSITVQIQVTAGGTTDIDIDLTEEALALDAIVVTGTAGGTRQRAIGNSVASVNAAELAAIAPISTFQELLAGREAGVTFKRSSGNVGTGSALRIRGYSSLNIGNNPLIYVDGIRVDNESRSGPNLRDGRQVNKMDDINPDDIESIEIIKGPSAATLYGTEASNGVINIITKRGTVGAPQFDLTIRQGATWLMNASEKVGMSYAVGPTGETISFNIWDVEKAAGRQFFSAGYMQAYALSMRGGTERTRYYLSADYDDATGIVEYNNRQTLSLRANVSVIPSETISLDMSMGYVDGLTSFMQQRTSWGVWEQAQWATPAGIDTRLRGFLRARPESIAEVEATRDNSRFTGSITIAHNPVSWFTQRLVVGLDAAREENRVLFPRHITGSLHDFGGLSNGDIVVERPFTNYTTVDYGASANKAFGSLGLTTSFGVQFYKKEVNSVISTGKVFPAPAITSLAGAASTTSTEIFIDNRTLGGFVQQEFSWNDRMFFTAAVRADDNSAFGSDADAAIYPKFSGTWVVSEESFFNIDFINSLRLRSAWGKAGQQPDVFAAVRLYRPAVGPDGAAAVSPDEVGNADLGPEVSTEIEGGFDAGLFNDRLSLGVTYYRQVVRDALVALAVPPSRGFPGSQSVNLGQLTNWGWETSLNGRLIDRPNLGVDLGMTFSFNRNRVDDNGGLPPRSLREGYPFPAVFVEEVLSADLNTVTGRAENQMCDGGTGKFGLDRGGAPVPCTRESEVFFGPLAAPYEFNFNSSVTLFRNVRLFALVDYRFGAYKFLTDLGCRHSCFRTSLASVVRDDPIFLSAVDDGFGSTSMHKSGFAKLREVSLNWTIPASLVARSGVSRASLSIAARNLWTIWVEQPEVWGHPVHDPEARNAGDTSTGSNSNVPPLATFVATMRVSF